MMRLLAGTSRSFVLTIKALPKVLRRPIGLAYLLARASDTIADSAATPGTVRVECLQAFVRNLHGEGDEVFALTGGIESANACEVELLAQLRRVVGAVEMLPDGDCAEIVALLEKITHGQQLDLERFPDAAEVRALETAAELDEYTYLVAGCVGEFWTRICGAHLPRYGRVGLDELTRLGRGFGQGLQLVNILRDVPEDLANGRCYLPMAELRAAGIASAAEVRSDPARAAAVFDEWRTVGLRHLEEGRRYIMAIRPWRIRYGCLIPWAMGVRTVELIGQTSPLTAKSRVKVGRSEVTRIMRRAVLAAISNGAVRDW